MHLALAWQLQMARQHQPLYDESVKDSGVTLEPGEGIANVGIRRFGQCIHVFPGR